MKKCDSMDIILENRELIYNGGILDYYQDTMRFSNGNIEKWDYIEHKPVVAIVPIDENDNIICVKQYRPAIGKYSIEIPAGGIGDDVDPKIGALRELREETGYECDIEKVCHLVDTYTSVGYTNELIYIYEGKVTKKGKTELDDNEFINVEHYSIDDLVKMIFSGDIEDGKTVAAIMSYIVKYKKFGCV